MIDRNKPPRYLPTLPRPDDWPDPERVAWLAAGGCPAEGVDDDDRPWYECELQAGHEGEHRATITWRDHLNPVVQVPPGPSWSKPAPGARPRSADKTER